MEANKIRRALGILRAVQQGGTFTPHEVGEVRAILEHLASEVERLRRSQPGGGVNWPAYKQWIGGLK